ncbi:hypothetical protein JA1_002990 [Spathaspora sp. JA1]|nr:hypothetical protein JA1_002990 [Spathaspora sp. JA1]
MVFLIDIILNVLTTIIPSILSIKALDTTIEYHFATYQFLLNYWLYYIILQYVQYQFISSNNLISISFSLIKIWMFYGDNNNLCLINNFFVSRGFHDYSRLKSYETRIINPTISRINPGFNSLSVVLNKLGKKYLNPIDYQSETPNIIDFFIFRIIQLLNYILGLKHKAPPPNHQKNTPSPRHKRSFSNRVIDERQKTPSRSSSIKSNRSRGATPQNRSRVATPPPEEKPQTQSPVPYPMGEYLEMPRSISDSVSKKAYALGRRTKSNGDYELDASIRKFRQQQLEQQVNYQPYEKLDGMKVDSNSLRAVQEYLNGDNLPEVAHFHHK